MTTAQDSGKFPSEIHLEKGQVYAGNQADPNRVIDLTKSENRQLVNCFKSEGHTGPQDWQDGDYRVEGDRLISMSGGSSSR